MLKGLLGALACGVLTVGVIWAGCSDVFQLAMSGDKALCAKVLDLFNASVDGNGLLRYERGAFQAIGWRPLDLRGQPPKVRRCSTLEQAVFDLDNDGTDDLVVRTNFCMKGKPSDSLYVFPSDSDVLQRASWQDLNPLVSTPDKFERTGGTYPLTRFPKREAGSKPAVLNTLFALQPFRFEGHSYVSLTDASTEWVVVARYRGREQFDDLCYLHRAP
jgi:hypothetical protein